MPPRDFLAGIFASVVVSLVPGTATAHADGASPFPIVTGNGSIASVQLIDPTTRYDHFVQGRQYEAAGIAVRLDTGETLTFSLPEDLVFEDTYPHLGDLDGDGEDEIVTVLSSVSQGACLAVLDLRDGAIVLAARTSFIGRPYRWLNVAGLGDFDGDGVLDIASVAMPHLVKRLDIHTLKEGTLDRIGTAGGFSNHRLGSVHTKMAVIADFNGDGIADLALPDAERHAIRLVGFAGRMFNEIAHLPLPAPADGAIALTVERHLTVGLQTGETVTLTLSGR